MSDGSRVKVVDPFGKSADRYGTIIVQVTTANEIDYYIRFDDGTCETVWEFLVSEVDE